MPVPVMDSSYRHQSFSLRPKSTRISKETDPILDNLQKGLKSLRSVYKCPNVQPRKPLHLIPWSPPERGRSRASLSRSRDCSEAPKRAFSHPDIHFVRDLPLNRVNKFGVEERRRRLQLVAQNEIVSRELRDWYFWEETPPLHPKPAELPAPTARKPCIPPLDMSLVQVNCDSYASSPTTSISVAAPESSAYVSSKVEQDTSEYSSDAPDSSPSSQDSFIQSDTSFSSTQVCELLDRELVDDIITAALPGTESGVETIASPSSVLPSTRAAQSGRASRGGELTVRGNVLSFSGASPFNPAHVLGFELPPLGSFAT